MRAPHEDDAPGERTAALPVVVEPPAPPSPAPLPDQHGREARVAAEQAAAPAPARQWPNEMTIVRYVATFGAVVCSIVLMILLGRSFPAVPWLPWLLGTIAYGALALRVWTAQHEAEQAARVRAENAERASFRMGGALREPVDGEGRWAS